MADTLCTFVHGAEATQHAKRCAEVLFGGSQEGLSSSELLEIFSEAPSSVVSRDQIDSLDMLSLLATTVAKSKGEARRLVQGGGIYVDNQRLAVETAALRDSGILDKGFIVLRSGKKNYHLVRIAE